MFQLNEKSHYNLHYTSEFIIPPINRVYHDSDSVSYLWPKIWELISPVIRHINTFSRFKKATKENGNLLTANAGFAKHTQIA